MISSTLWEPPKEPVQKLANMAREQKKNVRNSISRPISAAFSFSLVALVGVPRSYWQVAHRGARLIDDADPT